MSSETAIVVEVFPTTEKFGVIENVNRRFVLRFTPCQVSPQAPLKPASPPLDPQQQIYEAT